MTTYNRQQIQKVINTHRFEYQSIDLPFGLHTKGDKRNSDLDIILDKDLNNKSVLDIGCAYGYFCFEAEKRGSTEIYGTELKPHRFKGATLLKDIKNSKVNFLKQDLMDTPIDKTFDIILLLNVIHHLKYPIYFMKILSDMCNEKIVIEYPTTNDPKFSKTINYNSKLNSIPIIGVSLLDKGNDQTFLFNDSALKRILIDNNKLFKKVEFFDSHYVKGRRIAIFYK
tara:strand:- start:558 stop:1235 length:678 start_codon:yes stop_codon:yes gene_type:complete